MNESVRVIDGESPWFGELGVIWGGDKGVYTVRFYDVDGSRRTFTRAQLMRIRWVRSWVDVADEEVR